MRKQGRGAALSEAKGKREEHYPPGKKRNRVYSYQRYLTILSEGTEPL
ncbi:MAG: hypothetical protein HY700_08735 [Gemmatimonadetes bacterium]|nr:hypothetical protein [Gemmatimonadota bacterium]